MSHCDASVFFCRTPLSLLCPSCLCHQIAGCSVGDKGCCYSPQDSCGDKDVRGDDTSRTPVSSHKCQCLTSISCISCISCIGVGTDVWSNYCFLWWYRECDSHFVFYISVCVLPGKGAISGSAWETAATPPTLHHWGEDGGGLWEDEEGSGEGSRATKDSGITAEDTARQSAAGYRLHGQNRDKTKRTKCIFVLQTEFKKTIFLGLQLTIILIVS